MSQAASVLYDSYRRREREAALETEREKALEALRTLKDFNENVVQSIQDGLFTVDRDLRITFWNKGMEKTSGYPAEEVLGKNAHDVLPYLTREGVGEQLQAALEGQVAECSNCSYQTPEEKTIYTNEKYLPLRDQAGEVIGALVVVEDVTEVLHLEQRVDQLQEEIEQRKLVEVAKGVLMRVLGLPEAESYKLIQKMSRDQGSKMADMAKLVIKLHGTAEEREKFT